jgi:hypothetical protein
MGVHASDLGIAVRNYEGVADALQDARRDLCSRAVLSCDDVARHVLPRTEETKD